MLVVSAGYSQTAEEHFNKGLEKVSGRDYTGAIALYTKAITLDPKHALAYSARGYAKVCIKDFYGAKMQAGQKGSGCLDLRQAAELGFAEAFEAIRKYCDN